MAGLNPPYEVQSTSYYNVSLLQPNVYLRILERKMSQMFQRGKEFFIKRCAKVLIIGSLLGVISQVFMIGEIGITRAASNGLGFVVLLTFAAILLSAYVGYVFSLEEKKKDQQ